MRKENKTAMAYGCLLVARIDFKPKKLWLHNEKK